MRGYRLTDAQSEAMRMLEIDRALPSSEDINIVLEPFVVRNPYMKIRLIFDAPFCGREETVVDVPDNIPDDEINKLFYSHLGVQFDENCHWEIEQE